MMHGSVCVERLFLKHRFVHKQRFGFDHVSTTRAGVAPVGHTLQRHLGGNRHVVVDNDLAGQPVLPQKFAIFEFGVF